MNHSSLILNSRKLCPLRSVALRLASNTSNDDSSDKNKQASMAPNLSRLQNVLSKMKVEKARPKYLIMIGKAGNSDSFDYATNKTHSRENLKSYSSSYWDSLTQYTNDHCYLKLPFNGIEEMISLTEQGKLWKYPIDNDQGMEEEKQVPFEDHVFLEHLLEDFPRHDYILQFMSYICSGLSKNHHMTVKRKHEIIKFYRDYFNEHKEIYKTSGLDL